MQEKELDSLINRINITIAMSAIALIFSIISIVLVTISNSQHSTIVTTSNSQHSTIVTTATAQNFGHRLTNIDQPLNSSELSIINNAPTIYFEKAGEMLLNNTLNDPMSPRAGQKLNSSFVVNGKPGVIFLGAISCIWCGETRWPLALALSRFGNFTALYKGYSSFGDYDIPTLYWAQDNYTTRSGATFNNFYQSPYISFITIDYDSPITQGFAMQPISYFLTIAPNQTIKNALLFINKTTGQNIVGTPTMVIGNYLIPEAVGEVFGNTTPSDGTIPLTYETHEQVLQQIANFSDQFAYAEYASADIYIGYICSTINQTAPIQN
mgnify:CR=1 FL=1